MSGISAYQENAVTTQSSGHLIVMLYDGAVKFLKQAIDAMEAGNIADKGRFITKAMDIINELDGVLDMDAGGDIALNLRRLYCFMRGHMVQANIKSDPRMLRDVISLLEELNESWRAIAT
ncbi:MAG: flagellar export chaperone FliS [Planctomycetes bacterium]|nr:flagellar export chaperone FliS [Planctomycetota bacterium]